MRRWTAGRILAALVGAVGAASAVASGCGVVDGYDCHELLTCDIINEDGTNNGACYGICVERESGGFPAPPRIVWIGPATEQAPCEAAVLPNGESAGLRASSPSRVATSAAVRARAPSPRACCRPASP
ncbi:hypothetical protein [Sorangium sp. So ce204]|uniref:hypothetical protein n=1 Tax=Sorangium sp. So ce204 TaxID=3133288 RepID=UPI003F62A75A